MKTITSEDIQRYVRIALFYLSGTLSARGYNTEGTLWELISGGIIGAATLGWSIYGMRVNAKIAELSKLAKEPSVPIAGIITSNTVEGNALALAIPGPTVAAGSSAAKQLAA